MHTQKINVCIQQPFKKRNYEKKWIVPALTWRLHIYTDECLEKNARSFFVDIMSAVSFILKSSQNSLVIHSSLVFNIKKVLEVLKARNFECSNFFKDLVCYCCSKEDLVDLLGVIEAEQLEIFSANAKHAGQLLKTISGLSSSERFENRYLECLDSCDFVIFFSESDSSIEIMSTKQNKIMELTQLIGKTARAYQMPVQWSNSGIAHT